MEVNDLWPEFGDVPKIISPRSILVEQGTFLAQKTKNILSAEVVQGNSSDGRIVIHFNIIAPLLQKYTYRLFTLFHGVFYYPCDLRFQNQAIVIPDESALIEQLKRIFSHESTIRIINSLIVKVRKRIFKILSK